MKPFLLACALVLFLWSAAHAEEDPFAAGVRPTEPLSPVEEQHAFHLPPGFRIELVAAEPDIQKPMNMAFDGRGRLWVTDSTEYPFAAPADRPGRDTVKVLEDTDGDGRADKITTFADGLNIPIGVYPYGQGAIVFSIPNIWYLKDTDGDGRADEREVLLGPFGVDRDTHGMNNAFRRGFDGWIYACHGFANHSRVTAKDGSMLDVQSGNTYRFDPAGRHIEQYTWGQVNPFGMTFDPLGQIYTADCHTKPIMLLLRGGYYDSFGKPHDGLGYVPGVMQHDHGSTAIAGSVYYTGTMFPPEFRGNVFAGNVMTSRVNRDSLHYVGSTVRAQEEPDFIRTEDPWFRPVDLQIGPDGAMYIADFYNRIIGHYEVPIHHPGRDRHRGRIWRVTYEPGVASETPNLAAGSIVELIAAFGHPVLSVRMRATDELVDRFGSEAITALRGELSAPHSTESFVQAMWGLYRLAALAPDDIASAAARTQAVARVHAMRVCAETANWNETLAAVVRNGLEDGDPLVRRAAAEALIAQPHRDFVVPLMELYERTDPEDVHLRHAVKIALRNGLREPGSWAQAAMRRSQADRRLLADVCLGLPSAQSAAFLLSVLEQEDVDAAVTRSYLTHIAKHLPGEDVERVALVAQRRASEELDLQLDLLQAVRGGLQQRGTAENDVVRAWGVRLAEQLLSDSTPGLAAWRCRTLDGKPERGWNLEPRTSSDGVVTPFLSSLTLGERWTGTLRSGVFEIPGEMELYVCGHLGPPENEALPNNAVRLRLAENDEVVAQALAPRTDIAQRVQWNLASQRGRLGYLEVSDEIDLPAYAWIAVARLNPPVVPMPAIGLQALERRLVSGAELVGALRLRELTPALRRLVEHRDVMLPVRASGAKSLAVLSDRFGAAALAAIADQPALAAPLEERVFAAICEADDRQALTLMEEIMQTTPSAVQMALAQGLASSREGAEALVALIEGGKASAFLLANPSLVQRIKAALDAERAKRIDELVALLPSRDAAVEELIKNRRQLFDTATASPERGQAVFKTRCAACHQIGGEGAVIGPQLDGIGNRGLDRIIEDVLDPNRNIDQAFRMHTYVLDDGRILNGLPRRVEGELQVVADQEGKEVSFALASIDEDQPSPLSLMPESLGASISEQDFCDLMAYLSGQRVAGAAK